MHKLILASKSNVRYEILVKYNIDWKTSTDLKLIDAIDIIVHIFHPEKRKFYDLEKMWSEETPKEKAMIWEGFLFK